jgi:hypothetical protein
MMESLLTRARAQIRYLLYTLSSYSDFEYEFPLLLIQIPTSYKLNPTTITFVSQNDIVSEVIGVAK